MVEALAVLDLGTSAIKCGGIDGEEVTCFEVREQELRRRGAACELDFDTYADAAVDALDSVMQRVGDDARAVLITSQAQTFAPVDADFNPLCPGLSWLDHRAEAECRTLAEQVPDFAHATGFAAPAPGLYLCMLLRLKNEQPGLYSRAAYFPLISEFVAQRLTGRFFTDACTFGMGGALDIRTRQLNPDVLALLDLTPDHFPDIAAPMGLSYPVAGQNQPALLCGNDQSASAAGAGVTKPGDVSLNFGTAMVAYTLCDRLPGELRPGEIAGISPFPAPHFLLSYESEFGTTIERARSGMSHDDFFRSYDSDAAAREVIDRCLEQVAGHLAGIARVATPQRLFVSGGLAQSEEWIELLRRRCDQKIVCSARREAALIGAARLYRMTRS
jgi:sugar (pentulose or hexulose) kinase